MLEQLEKDYGNSAKITTLGKPKSIDKSYLIYNLPLRKPKKIEWGFLKVTAILSTLLVYSNQAK